MVDRDGPPAHLLSLPIYLQTYILNYLSEKDLQRMAIASKRLCELSSQPQVQGGWTFTHGLLEARARLRWGVWASVDREQRALSAAIARYSRRMASCPLSPPTVPSIPHVIHMIWLGSPPPAYVSTMRDSWVQHHPGWECRLWRDADVAQLPQGFVNREAYEAADNYGEKSDILRYEILYQLGGVYADCDMECVVGLQDLHGWEGVGLYAGLSNTGTLEANNGLIGSRPGHPLLARMIDEIRQGHQTRRASTSALGPAGALSALMGGGGVGEGGMSGLMASFLGGSDLGMLQHVVSAADRDRAAMETITRTGPGLLTRHLFQSLLDQPPGDSGGDGDGSDVLVLPPLWFYPMPNCATHAGPPDDPQVKARYVHPTITRAIHYWARSWQA